MNTSQLSLPVAVIGAGPVGLATAAHLHERGLPFVVFEAGDDVADHVRDWGHVRLFSPWRFDIDPAAGRLLEASGWQPPDPHAHPTGAELIERYLAPLALLPEIAGSLRTARRVTAVTRAWDDDVYVPGAADVPFVVTTEGAHGIERLFASAVIDSSGTWGQPRHLGGDGRPAIGEADADGSIASGIPDVLGRDRADYAGRRVAVVGSGHTAQNVIRDLVTLGRETGVGSATWIVRRSGPERMFGGTADDQLVERGRLGSDAQALVTSGLVTLVTDFRTVEVDRGSGGVTLVSDDWRQLGPFDRVIAATGARPDLEPLRDLRLDLDPNLESTRTLAPLIDPAFHSCGSVPPHGAAELAHPEPGFYIAGAK
ncbi:MAG TPA: FAD-dependent oxidoreductase, partial [Iamia sp.]